MSRRKTIANNSKSMNLNEETKRNINITIKQVKRRRGKYLEALNKKKKRRRKKIQGKGLQRDSSKKKERKIP